MTENRTHIKDWVAPIITGLIVTLTAQFLTTGKVFFFTFSQKIGNSNNWPIKREMKAISKHGKGNGKLTLYKTCNSCENIHVSIDNINIGTLIKSFTSVNSDCDADGTLNRILKSGLHSVVARGSHKQYFNFTIYVPEGECIIKELAIGDEDTSLQASYQPYIEDSNKETKNDDQGEQ